MTAPVIFQFMPPLLPSEYAALAESIKGTQELPRRRALTPTITPEAQRATAGAGGPQLAGGASTALCSFRPKARPRPGHLDLMSHDLRATSTHSPNEGMQQ